MIMICLLRDATELLTLCCCGWWSYRSLDETIKRRTASHHSHRVASRKQI